MKNILMQVILLLVFCLTALAEPRYGIANLGIAKYGDVAVEGHPEGFANVSFTEIFGDAYEEIDQLLATGKVPFQEYDLKWLDDHGYKPSHFPGIVEEAKKFSKLAEKYPNVECAFSGATEHKLNKEQATKLAKMVLAVIPERCIYVNNPWTGKGAFITPGPRVWNEVHGADAKPPNVGGKYIWNADGSDIFDYNVEVFKKRFKDAEYIIWWTSQNNGRKNRNDSTPRPLRQAWPVVKLLKAMAFLSTPMGKPRLPAGSGKKAYTIKPKSDQHNVPPEFRALKPVFIFPIKADRIVLKAAGRVVITSEGWEPFEDGRRRYYFPMFGWEIVFKAKQAVLDIFPAGSNEKIGTANPGFRY